MGKGKKSHQGSAQTRTKGGTGSSSSSPLPLRLPAVQRKEPWAIISRPVLGDKIIEVDGVLSAQECQAFIAAAEAHGFKHQGSGGATAGEAYRDNHRIQVDDAALAQQLWDKGGLGLACAELRYCGMPAVGLSSNIRVYRYSVGQKFGKHVDDSQQLPCGGETGYTLLVYLNGGESKKQGGLLGGETVFYGDRGEKVRSVAPRGGMALLHLHGEECLEHEGAEVRMGTKYILRSDVVFRSE